jgi:hypothetical protein
MDRLLNFNENNLLNFNKMTQGKAWDLLKIHIENVEIQHSLLKIHIENVEIQQSKTCEISSKMQFLGENSAIRADIGEGGFRGVGSLNNSTGTNTVTGTSTQGTLPNNNVTSTISLKEKNTKKRKENGLKFSGAYSDEFEKFHRAYPNKNGKSKAFEYWEKYRRAGSLPETGYLLACIDILRSSPEWRKEDGQFIPMCKTWLGNRRWEDLPEEKVHARITRNAAPKEESAAAGKARIPANLELPPFEEWREMNTLRQRDFEKTTGYTQSEILKEIIRRKRAKEDMK